MDLLPLPDIVHLKDKAGRDKAEYVKKLHEEIKAQIEKKSESYARHANKGRKKVVFEPGDWVWVHFRKERFPSQRKSKLMPRGDGPFQVISKINDNAYKIDLPGEYAVSATFNVSDLSPFDAGEEDLNLRTNSIQEGGNDENIGGCTKKEGCMEDLEGLGGPMTRSKSKKTKEALNKVISGLVETKFIQEEHKDPKLVQCIQRVDSTHAMG